MHKIIFQQQPILVAQVDKGCYEIWLERRGEHYCITSSDQADRLVRVAIKLLPYQHLLLPDLP